MLKRKLGLAVAAVMVIGMMSSCVNIIDTNKDDTPAGNGIDYTDYKTYSIAVRNESAKNVVCFKGTPSEDTLISGAHGGQTTHLKLDTKLFDKSGDFVLFVVTEEDYLANKGNLKTLANTPFAQLYAYYNADSDSNANMVYTISSVMGGQYYILINNSSKYNVELRQNGLYGDSLACAGATTVQTKIGMMEGDYNIFPVFRKFNKKSGEIMTSFPQYTIEGKDYPVFFQFSLDSETTSQEFNTENWFNGVEFNATETPSAAYVTIYNGNGSTGVSLYKGANAEATVTSTGGKNINGGKSLTFEVPMTSLGSGTYSKSAKVAGWRIGTSMRTVDVPELEVNAGYMYYIDVAGKNFADMSVAWKMSGEEYVAEAVNFDEE